MPRRRVVVTGIGAVTPVGNTVEEMWASLREAKSGIGRISHFPNDRPEGSRCRLLHEGGKDNRLPA